MRLDRVAALHAVPDLVHVAGLQIAGDDAAGGGADAERGALFVRPHHHLERMARLDLRRLHRLDHSSAANDPRSPSKLPPVGTESMCDPNRIGG